MKTQCLTYYARGKRNQNRTDKQPSKETLKGCVMDDQIGKIDKTIKELEQGGVSTKNYKEIEGLGDLI